MPKNKSDEINLRVRLKDSEYKPCPLNRFSLPTACKEFKEFLDDSLLDLFFYNKGTGLWNTHCTVYAGRALRLQDCIHHTRGWGGQRLSLTFSIVLPNKSENQHYRLVLREDKGASYQLLETRVNVIEVGGILITQQQVPDQKKYGSQKLVFVKR